MKALVTGGAGFIGSVVARQLIAQGHSVRVVDNLETGSRENVPGGAEFHELDVRDPDVLALCEGMDVVLHIAALRSVPRSVDHPVRSVEANVVGAAMMLDAATRAGVGRFVFASSSSIYGDGQAPLSPYAVSKLAGEHLCRVWSSLYELPTIVLRYFNVFGPGQPVEGAYSGVFPAFVSAMLDPATTPVIHGDGTRTRDFTYISDVVRATVLAATTEAIGAYDIGSGAPRSVMDVYGLVARILGYDGPVTHESVRRGDVRDTHADVGPAARDLGWTPEADWYDSVRTTVAWLAEGAEAPLRPT